MKIARVILAVYALLLLGGGIAGFSAAGSVVSLVTGIASCVLCLAAFALSRSSARAGLGLGAACALALCVVFAIRWSQSGKFLPAGLLGLLSLVTLAALLGAWPRIGRDSAPSSSGSPR